MIFEFYPDSNLDYIGKFATQLGITYSDNFLQIPSPLGEGFIKEVHLESDLKILIHKYQLKQGLTIRRLVANEPHDILTFRFISRASMNKNYLSNVQVLNCHVAIDDFITPDEIVYYVIVSISKDKLESLTELNAEIRELKSFFNSLNKPLLYQEAVTFEMNKILEELSELQENGMLEKFYYKMRIVELLYLFFNRFFKRSVQNATHANKLDIEKIITIEKVILRDLSVQPNLPSLAIEAGMSGTKMKSLFKEIFGSSIYNYYQHARMMEAASLLKSNKNLSVSEVGYQLGFSNLGHFSRIFKKIMGVNPKVYAKARLL
jgi:AraC-like DNA-binding protein